MCVYVWGGGRSIGLANVDLWASLASLLMSDGTLIKLLFKLTWFWHAHVYCVCVPWKKTVLSTNSVCVRAHMPQIYLALAMHSSVASLPVTTVVSLGPITIVGATTSDSGSVKERGRERDVNQTQQHNLKNRPRWSHNDTHSHIYIILHIKLCTPLQCHVLQCAHLS